MLAAFLIMLREGLEAALIIGIIAACLRGSLTVLPSAVSEAERKAPPATAFIGALSEYRVFTLGAANALVKATTALETAIRNGDRDAARTAWLSARLAYKRIEPLASRFAALENAIDPLPDYLAGREADPAYTGFHPIEAGLWGAGDLSLLLPLATRLQQDSSALREALKATKPGPADLAALAQRQAQLIAETQAVTPQSAASGADLADLGAAVEGISRPLTLLLPLLREADPAFATRLEAALSAARPPVEDRPEPREAFASALRALASLAGEINPRLGLE